MGRELFWSCTCTCDKLLSLAPVECLRLTFDCYHYIGCAEAKVLTTGGRKASAGDLIASRPLAAVGGAVL